MGRERRITHIGCHVAGRLRICQSDWHLLCKPVPCDQDRGGEVGPRLEPEVSPMEPSRISQPTPPEGRQQGPCIQAGDESRGRRSGPFDLVVSPVKTVVVIRASAVNYSL